MFIARLATTCEWDVAAGQALVVAAGGIVKTPQGLSLEYGRVAEHFRVPAFIAWGDAKRSATAAPDETALGLLSQGPDNVGPFALGGIDDTARIREERGACLLAVKKIEPLSRHNPD